jgi:TrpR-related protein YerC/YecD
MREGRYMKKNKDETGKREKNLDVFFSAILSLKNSEECDKFFEDIFTAKELIDIPQRLEVAMLLLMGKTYQEVGDVSGASNSTITRVSRCIQYGRGGYRQIKERI